MNSKRRHAFSPGDVVVHKDPRASHLHLVVSVQPSGSATEATLLIMPSGSHGARMIMHALNAEDFRWVMSGRKIR